MAGVYDTSHTYSPNTGHLASTYLAAAGTQQWEQLTYSYNANGLLIGEGGNLPDGTVKDYLTKQTWTPYGQPYHLRRQHRPPTTRRHQHRGHPDRDLRHQAVLLQPRWAHSCGLDYTLEVRERYDWGVPSEGRLDLQKGWIKFSQPEVAHLNTVGLARDFDVYGKAHLKG